jgi:uncharacterized protein (DUF952 family)
MMRTLILSLLSLTLVATVRGETDMPPIEHPYVFHLVQARLWDPAVESGSAYFPPTYQVDGFTHGTSNPDKLLNVANHFYPDVAGKWYCLRMTVESLADTGVKTIFEGTAPVGDTPPEFEGADDELFPHILGGIHPNAVLEVHPVVRADDGTFLSITGVTDQ